MRKEKNKRKGKKGRKGKNYDNFVILLIFYLMVGKIKKGWEENKRRIK